MSAPPRAARSGTALALVLLVLLVKDAVGAEGPELEDEPRPYDVEGIPDRPRPVLELGESFLGTGPLGEGIELPTGAVWRPSFLVWGTYRTAFQVFDRGASGTERISEWANRLDVFGQLRLAPTERFVIGFRPLDDQIDYTGYVFEPNDDDGWETEFEDDLRALFFEGDLTEIFPNLDPADRRRLDYGFSVGRQPLIFQDGMLMIDVIDSVGVVRNNLFLPNTSNTRATFLYGWNQVNRRVRGDPSRGNPVDRDASLYGLFFETDTRRHTVNLDLVYVGSNRSRGDGLFGGISSVQRIGRFNTTFRALGSWGTDGETAEIGNGALFFAEASYSPPHGHDHAYVTFYWGPGDFTSAARDRDAGGPLGRVGILFAAVGLGRYGAPLGNDADDSFGGALGYQMFFHDTRRQLILELGGRQDTDGSDMSGFAFGARYQQAIGRRLVGILDGFAGRLQESGLEYGARAELRVEF